MSLGNRAPSLALAMAYAVAGIIFTRPLLAAPVPAATAAPALPATPRPASPSSTPAPSRTPTLTPTATSRPTARATATPATPRSTPQPVEVLRTCPVDGDSDLLPAAPVHIVFDQAMDMDPASVGVTITPTLSFGVEWPVPEHLLIRTAPREPGVLYRLTLGEARSRLGGPLAQPLALTFGQGGQGAPIPILMYHHVQPLESYADAEVRRWTVSPQQFASHLDLLASLGAHVVSLGEVVGYLQGGEPLPARPVVITFDDGYRSPYERAVPILLARGLTATFFITPAYIGSTAFMDWSEVKDLVEAGFTIGAHGYEHIRANALGTMQAERQFGLSRRVLEEKTGAPVLFFAYPYGYLSSRAMAQLAAYGYRAAVGVDPAVHQKPDRLLNLGRIAIGYGEPLEKLREQLPWEWGRHP